MHRSRGLPEVTAPAAPPTWEKTAHTCGAQFQEALPMAR